MALSRSVYLVEAELPCIHTILFCFLENNASQLVWIKRVNIDSTQKKKRIGYDVVHSKRHCMRFKTTKDKNV